MIGTGALIGLVGAAAGTRLPTSGLFGVEPLDPTTFAAVAVLLVVTATLAVAGPARRAIRVDPAATLRGQ